MDEKLLKNQICDIGRRMYERGMVAANDGNISVRISDNEILCTPTGISKGFMTPECICKVDLAGNVLEAVKDFRPSSEMKMHLRVYEKRADIKAVVHAHPKFATAFAITRTPLDKPILSEAVVTLGTVPVTKYGTPSTKEIPDAVEEYVKDYNAILLANHGALTWSDELMDAYYKMESLEFYAELTYRTKMLGNPHLLDNKEVEKLYEIREKMKKRS